MSNYSRLLAACREAIEMNKETCHDSGKLDCAMVGLEHALIDVLDEDVVAVSRVLVGETVSIARELMEYSQAYEYVGEAMEHFPLQPAGTYESCLQELCRMTFKLPLCELAQCLVKDEA